MHWFQAPETGSDRRASLHGSEKAFRQDIQTLEVFWSTSDTAAFAMGERIIFGSLM